MLDIIFCIIALPAFALATMFVALLIAAVSPGPLFFRQERVGYMGRRFMLYKFRTMHVGVETESHRAHVSALLSTKRPMQKLDASRDSRLIAGGWLLRASGLDELPQLLNVLIGDMSLVGPRPCIPYEYQQYSAWQRARFSSAPGLTGLWQVSGKNRTTFDEMIRLDIKYSETKSLWLDLKIITRTLPALWTQILDTRILRRDRVQTSANASTNTATATVQT
jgi:lipopolysaccharide/colanic/teichoic acid biosynthesis glycosyltransferase